MNKTVKSTVFGHQSFEEIEAGIRFSNEMKKPTEPRVPDKSADRETFEKYLDAREQFQRDMDAFNEGHKKANEVTRENTAVWKRKLFEECGSRSISDEGLDIIYEKASSEERGYASIRDRFSELVDLVVDVIPHAK